jgi:MFS family permease
VLTGVAAALGLTVIFMSRIVLVMGMAVAITLTRGFGQSALSVVSLAAVGKWFASRLGVAMGVYSLLVGIGFIIAFPLVGQAAVNLWIAGDMASSRTGHNSGRCSGGLARRT